MFIRTPQTGDDIMRTFLIAAALTLPFSIATPIYAAGGGEESAPKPTKTSKDCKGVRVWDEKKQRCVRPKKSSLDDTGLYDAVRELAYAGRYEDAQGVLAAMSDQNDDRVLTYKGFTNRKLGKIDVAMVFYQQALDTNPNNILARSYMGQGMLDQGDKIGAIAQLREINARGGSETWAAKSLANAISTGVTYSH
jgi:tetratricopeptide (TPR) repeat protein